MSGKADHKGDFGKEEQKLGHERVIRRLLLGDEKKKNSQSDNNSGSGNNKGKSDKEDGKATQNAVMEAMSFGLPAVVSRYTAQPEVVGESGYVLLEIEPEEISRCLNQYISLTYEEKLDLNKKVLDRIEEKFLFERRLSSFEQAISLIDPL